jgi:hypothetical protein
LDRFVPTRLFGIDDMTIWLVAELVAAPIAALFACLIYLLVSLPRAARLLASRTGMLPVAAVVVRPGRLARPAAARASASTVEGAIFVRH